MLENYYKYNDAIIILIVRILKMNLKLEYYFEKI